MEKRTLQIDTTFIIALLSVVISIFSAFFAFIQQRTGKKNLSLTAFLESIDQLGTEEPREAINYVINNIPDYSKSEFQPDHNNSTGNERRPLRIAKNPSEINDVSNIVKEKVLIKTIMGKDEEILWFTAVGFDRVGFMLFELGLPKDIREKYLKWMGGPICNVWNRLAPYIAEHRIERPNYTPYFQHLAEEAYRYYYNQMMETNNEKMPKLVVINPALQHHANSLTANLKKRFTRIRVK